MTATTGAPSALPLHARRPPSADDRTWSWVPTWRMIAARWTELRKRRGLMVLLATVTVGIPTVFLVVRLLLHAIDPKSYGPAGGYSAYVGLVAGVLYVFGFIVAATLGATAGSVDLSEGMFRHHVIAGRSRVALYLARIPAGLGIIVPLVAIGFTVVCTVCVLAAPSGLTYDGVPLPAQLSKAGLDQWAGQHASEVVGSFAFRITPSDGGASCLPGPGPGPIGGFVKRAAVPSAAPCTPSQLRALAVRIADQNYADYARHFASPSVSLMVKTGLWIELEAVVAFLVGLGLASLLGQRTVAVVLLIVLELILTPLAVRSVIPHLVNLQRAVLGAATAHLEPGGLPSPFGNGGGPGQSLLVHETTLVAVCVIAAWTVGWTVVGAWRMATRDA